MALWYAAPRVPLAGDMAAAVHSPTTPPMVSTYMGFVAKPLTRLKSTNAPMANMSRPRRPKVSATLAKKRSKAPELSLCSC